MISFNEREAVKADLMRIYQEKFCGVHKMMLPTPGIMMFLPFCIGSRAECRSVGMQGKHVYVDLKSAFVSSLLKLPDQDLRTCYTTTGTGCIDRMKSLLKRGAFQLAGVELSWIFKPGVEPTMPLKTVGRRFNNQATETLIFPRSGKGLVMWTEFYAAYTAGLLQFYIIHSIIEFESLETHYLANRIKDLLVMRRGDENGVIKALLNLFYGKTIQGLGDLEANPFDVSGLSSISCFPIGGYVVGACRAIIGEIINNNNWIAIASDAVVVSGRGPVKTGPLAEAIQEEMTPLGYTFVENEFLGSQGLFLRSRGYILSGRKVKDGVPSEKTSLKIANMGMKTDRKPDEFDPDLVGYQQVDDFMTGLITGKLRCFNFQSFSDLEAEYKKNKEQREELQRELRNNRNMQSRLRQSAGISSSRLEVDYEKLGNGQSFRDYEHDRVVGYIAAGGPKAHALAQVLAEYDDLRQRYEEVAAYEIFPRKYFYTVGVNHSYDFKRVPIAETILPQTVEFDYGPSDGSFSTHYKFNHVSFTTRPLYSAAEYQQLIQNASYRMEHQDYVKMMQVLQEAGVLSTYHEQQYQPVRDAINSDSKLPVNNLSITE